MRIQTLHRRVIRDMDMMFDDVNAVFPPKMPKRYETRRMNLGAFVKRLNTVTTKFNVCNELHDDAEIPRGAAAVAGFWYPEDLLPENDSDADIRVTWHPNPAAHRIKMTPMQWARRRYYFWERLAHELVHRYQSLDRPDDAVSRTFRVRTDNEEQAQEQQQYYNDYDELEAYAHDAALELSTWWPGCTIQQAIAQAQELRNDARVNATYNTYLTTFEVGHPARPHFRRKVKQWYHAMQQTPDFYSKLALPRLV
jgi:hypothetical protein